MPCPPTYEELTVMNNLSTLRSLMPLASESVKLLNELPELFEPFYEKLDKNIKEELKTAQKVKLQNVIFHSGGWPTEKDMEADLQKIEDFRQRMKRDELMLCRLHTEFFKLLQANKKSFGKDKTDILKRHRSFHYKHRKADRDEWVKSLEHKLKLTQNESEKADIEKQIAEAKALTRIELLTSREYTPNRSSDNK